MKTLMLNNNKNIPSIGFGTWKFPDDDSTANVVSTAIQCGYRHIDTAFAYQNEISVGKGIKQSGIKREDIFITGKLWNDDRGYDNIINACKRTISNLDCEYLDLYLIHWPASNALYTNWAEINSETWKAMEYLYNQGLVKAIGVCNFKKTQLEELLKTSTIVPMINQIEFHPGFRQEETVDYCKEKGIVVEAWSPLGSGKMLKKESLINIASKYNVSVAQLCIKWCLQNGVIPLPKSEDVEKMNENLNINDFEISDDDMKLLNNLPYMGGSGLDSERITIFN